jgi:membrane protease YdiL (CAAX protease family)
MPSPSGRPQNGWMVPLGVYALLCAFFGVAAALLIRKHPVELGEAVGIYGCFVLLLGACLLPAFRTPCAWLQRQVQALGAIVIVIPVFIVPYLLYAASTGDFRWFAFARLLALVAVPVVVYSIFPVTRPDRMNWQDILAWLWWMVPTVLRLTAGIWRVPVNLDFMTRLVIVGVTSWSWIVVRRVPKLGYEFALTPAVIRAAASNVLLFAAVAVPIGTAMGFVSFNPQWKGIWPFSFDFVTILLFIAVLEELFFRGILLRLLGETIGVTRAHVLSSVVFGLSHVLYSPAPNWRYVALATAAGWFYGRAYRQTQTLAAPCLAHALVDTIWRTWFGRGTGSILG